MNYAKEPCDAPQPQRLSNELLRIIRRKCAIFGRHPGGALLSSDRSSNDSWLVQLKEQLKQQRYSSQATLRRIAVAERFLAYLDQRSTAVETAEPSEVDLYLRNELQLFHLRYRRAPRSSPADWRRSHTGGIDMLLRLVRGQCRPGRRRTILPRSAPG